MLTGAGLAAAPGYKVLDRIKVGDGSYDYVTFDPVTARVYFAREDYTTVIETKMPARPGNLMSAPHGHMAIPIPGTTLVALPEGQGGSLRVVDTATDTMKADISVGQRGPDGAVYDPYSKLVYLS